MTKLERAKMTVAKIDKLIEQLKTVCDNFDSDCSEDETLDWNETCRLSYCTDHVKSSIDVLRKMRDYYETTI